MLLAWLLTGYWEFLVLSLILPAFVNGVLYSIVGPDDEHQVKAAKQPDLKKKERRRRGS
jgi:hypothetical protein